jgi:hypothetical protein
MSKTGTPAAGDDPLAFLSGGAMGGRTRSFD